MTKEHFKSLLKKLINSSEDLLTLFAITYFDKETLKKPKYQEKIEIMKNRNFGIEYQGWYSQALLIIKTFLPERLDEFVSLYQPQKNRKEIDETNYTILDALTNVSSVWIQESGALNKLIVQIHILKSLEEIINSRLDELNIILEFDVFEKELDAAKMLHKNKYYRSAGAICGVLIEKHLTTMLNKRNIKIIKKDPCINDLNQLLYTNNIIDLTQTKFLIYMGDIRNKCDHNKKDDPTPEEVSELINGTDKIIKTYS